jgi:hypothetical protein
MTTILCDPNSPSRIPYDACASLNFDLQKVDMLTLRRQSPRMTDPEKQILTSLRCLPKGTGKERIRTDMQQLIKDERLNKHDYIYTDGSLWVVGCAEVLFSSTLKCRLLPQTTIFNSEMFAILKTMVSFGPNKQKKKIKNNGTTQQNKLQHNHYDRLS